MHHHFGSRFLIDSLHHHGFCSSYSEVQNYERNAAVATGIDLDIPDGECLVQYVADNVGHNVTTIDGKNTFHGMGLFPRSLLVTNKVDSAQLYQDGKIFLRKRLHKLVK
eukprot:gene14577-16079_t